MPERKLESKIIADGDILVVKASGSATSIISGRAALVRIVDGKRYGFANFILRLKVDRSQYDPYLLTTILNSSAFRRRIPEVVSSTTYPNLRIDQFLKLPIPKPTADEQRRLVDLLSRAENIVRMRREAEQKAKEIIPALFLDMFGDPATNPRGWETRQLGDITRIVGGSSLPAGKPFENENDGVLLVKVGDMNRPGNEVELRSSAEWAPGDARSYSRVPAGSILLPKRGAAIATNKKRLSVRPSLLDPNLMGIVPDEAIVERHYLYQWFIAFDLAKITSGTTVPQLNKADLAPLAVPIPPIVHQSEFGKRAGRLRALVCVTRDATRAGEEVFQSLLAGVFGDAA